MPQRLPIAISKEKTANASENLLKKIRQTRYFLQWAKEISKKGYNNIMNSINL